MKIETASQEDARDLSDLGARTFTDKFGHLYRAEDLAAFLAETHTPSIWEALLENPEVKTWIIRDVQGVAVAYGMVGPVQLPVDAPLPEGAIEFKRLYVDQRAQGRGLGTRLLKHILAWIDRDGVRPVYLSVYKYNEGAQRLYERYGFSLLKEITFKVGDHYDPEYLYGRLNGG